MSQATEAMAAPAVEESRRARAARLTQAGRFNESLPLWREEMGSGAAGAAWVHAATLEAMQWRDLTVASELARLHAAATWGSAWYPGRSDRDAATRLIRERPPRTQLSVAKLQHDMEQFRLLRERGVLGFEFDEIIDAYAEISQRMIPAGPETRWSLDRGDETRIGHVYNRIVHITSAPRAERALSSMWSATAVEDRYLEEPPGIVVIDDFLSPPALAGVQRFCLESTVWSGTRYSEGRLGAFFLDGFNAPLLVQIADEVRAAFPRVIGDRRPLRQLWGFKYAPFVDAESTIHADFAAVNVNLWVTPQRANLDPRTGGLVIYDVTAPPSWDFETYNRRPDLIIDFLKERNARAVTIPYRENRAILFSSDLFHATSPLRFRSGYEDRRINITLLYGDRVEDQSRASHAVWPASTYPSARRSRALGRAPR